MSQSCHSEPENKPVETSCHSSQASGCHESGEHGSSCHPPAGKPDYLLWGSLFVVAFLYLQFYFLPSTVGYFNWYEILASSVFELINTMWVGITLGILMVAVLSKIPREFVISVLGTSSGFRGVIRATAAGVLLDLCNHGILMVGAKLYERGASIGQVVAFLIASPWNSFSLTLILIALIGLKWTVGFIFLSMFIAIVVGVIFDALVKRGNLPSNPHQRDLPEGFRFWPEAKRQLSETQFNNSFFISMFVDGVKDSRMVIRWIFFGVVLAGMVRAFVPADIFGNYFGPTFAGLMLTVVAATIIEVCSEGSTPIAADLLTRANAPGNSFAFLMTGAATDYTEIMVLRDTTQSWKIPLFLPLLSVPQVIFIAWVINYLAVS